MPSKSLAKSSKKLKVDAEIPESRLFNMRMRPVDEARLDALVKDSETNRSQVIRTLLKEAVRAKNLNDRTGEPL